MSLYVLYECTRVQPCALQLLLQSFEFRRAVVVLPGQVSGPGQGSDKMLSCC